MIFLPGLAARFIPSGAGEYVSKNSAKTY